MRRDGQALGFSSEPPQVAPVVLVVDDEPVICALLEKILVAHGYEVRSASTATAALEILGTTAFDAVLFDIALPDEDGFTLLQRMHQRLPAETRPPVIFLSALSDPEHIARGYQLGAFDFLPKPIDPQTLLNHVQVLVQVHRSERLVRQQRDELRRSEERLQLIMATAPVGICILGPDRRVRTINQAAGTILGQPPAQAIGRSCHEIFGRHCNLCLFDARQPESPEEEIELLAPVGRAQRVLRRCRSLPEAPGEGRSFIITLVDITARQTMEAELRGRNDELVLLNRIAETLANAHNQEDVFTGCFTLLQAALPCLLGVAFLAGPDGLRLINQHPPEPTVTTPAWLQKAVWDSGLWEQLQRERQAVHLRFAGSGEASGGSAAAGSSHGMTGFRPDVFAGAGLHNLLAVPIQSKDTPLGLLVLLDLREPTVAARDLPALTVIGQQLGIALDNLMLVRELLQQNSKLSAQQERLEQLNRELSAQQEQLVHSSKLASIGVLAAGVAHEVNNPVSIIQGLADQLLRGIVPQSDSADSLKIILECADRIGTIVSNLLQFSRPDPVRLIPCQLDDVIRRTLTLTDVKLRKAQIEVTLQLPADLPLIAGRPNELQHVFLNLLANAEFALRERTSGRKVQITSTVVGSPPQRVLVHVRDNGCGIPKELRQRVFDPFFTTKSRAEGTGLGLSIVHSILAAHRATIEVASEPGQFADFALSFPVLPLGVAE